jgi:hypothetical protein
MVVTSEFQTNSRKRHDEDQEEQHPAAASGLAEPAGEEHDEELHDYRRRQEQRGPVMELSEEKTAGGFEGECHDGVERLGDFRPVQKRVAAVVGDRVAGRFVQEHQQDSRDEQDDRAGEGDDTEEVAPLQGDPSLPKFFGQCHEPSADGRVLT